MGKNRCQLELCAGSVVMAVVVSLRTVDKGVQDELAVLLDEVVDVAENSTRGQKDDD